MKPADVTANLPNDIAQCHALITHLDAHNRELSSTLQEQQRLTARLQQQVEVLLRRIYGPRSERVDPGQLVLFGEEVAAAQETEAVPEDDAASVKPAAKKGHGRKPLPK